MYITPLNSFFSLNITVHVCKSPRDAVMNYLAGIKQQKFILSQFQKEGVGHGHAPSEDFRELFLASSQFLKVSYQESLGYLALTVPLRSLPPALHSLFPVCFCLFTWHSSSMKRPVLLDFAPPIYSMILSQDF